MFSSCYAASREMQPCNGRMASGILEGSKAFRMIVIETEFFEHKYLILMICLAILLIKLYAQNLVGTLKLTLSLQGKSSGAFMDPDKFG